MARNTTNNETLGLIAKTPKAAEAVEDVVDGMLADLALSRHIGSRKAKALGRANRKDTLTNTQSGLVYSYEQALVRKFYVKMHAGECRVEIYRSSSEFQSGRPPFKSAKLHSTYLGKVFYEDKGAATYTFA